MAETFKPGDLVKLKSGSPTMTVAFASGDGDYVCVYFLDAVQRRTDPITGDALVKTSEDSGYPRGMLSPRG